MVGGSKFSNVSISSRSRAPLYNATERSQPAQKIGRKEKPPDKIDVGDGETRVQIERLTDAVEKPVQGLSGRFGLSPLRRFFPEAQMPVYIRPPGTRRSLSCYSKWQRTIIEPTRFWPESVVWTTKPRRSLLDLPLPQSRRPPVKQTVPRKTRTRTTKTRQKKRALMRDSSATTCE